MTLIHVFCVYHFHDFMSFHIITKYQYQHFAFFLISFKDEEPPTVLCPDDIIRQTDPGIYSTIVNWTNPLVTDNSGASVGLVESHPSGSSFFAGNTTVNIYVEDESGNSASCSFYVIVIGKKIHAIYYS